MKQKSNIHIPELKSICLGGSGDAKRNTCSTYEPLSKNLVPLNLWRRREQYRLWELKFNST